MSGEERKPIKPERQHIPRDNRDSDRKGDIGDRRGEDLTTDWLKPPPPPREKGE